MIAVDVDVSPDVYNQLPVVEEADRYVNDHDLVSRMTSTLGEVFLRHDIENSWGVGLLHHHWPIYPGEKPAEDLIYESGNATYITKPRDHGELGYVPSLLAANNLAEKSTLFTSLEFSSDKTAIAAYEVLGRNVKFVTEVYTALMGAGLEQYFGLTSLKFASAPNLTFMEYTQPSRASILRLVDQREMNGINYVQTGWSFSKQRTAANCKRSCFKACNVPRGGGHYSTHTALHNPNG